jgi:isopentenyl-diphosphate delta-isomerase
LNDAFRGSHRAAANDVSTDVDALILVDEADRELGHLSKDLCHDGRGILHRAFSLLIFNDLGELLLQQRAPSKRLWPMYWSNSCCSHPRRGESMEAAIKRRLVRGARLKLPFAIFVQVSSIRRNLTQRGAEHELCSVFIARCSDEPKVNRNEIVGWRWITPLRLRAKWPARRREFTPWFMLEWARIWRDHRPAVSPSIEPYAVPRPTRYD